MILTELHGKGTYAIQARRGLDVLSGKMLDDAVVLVENNTIQAFGKGLKPPSGAKTFELGDVTLLPGLHDNHCHIMLEPKHFDTQVFKRNSARMTLDALVNIQKTLWAGFTTIRDPGDSDRQYGLVDLRNFVNAGMAAGPRMLVAPHYLSITGGHGDANDYACDFCMLALGKVVDGVDAMRKAVREEIKYGADWIKLFASGGVLSMGDDPSASHYSRDELQVAAQETHRLGKKITAHAHGAEAVRFCAEAGFDSIEHCTMIDDEGLKLMKDKGVYCVPTLYVIDFLTRPGNPMGVDISIIEKAKRMLGFQRDRFSKIVKAGVPVSYGTDIGVFPHGENWRDFPCMTECGMAPVDAIRTATINSAKMNGLEAITGSLTEGKRADVIAVAGNPLDDVNLMSDVRFVMKDGAVYRMSDR